MSREIKFRMWDSKRSRIRHIEAFSINWKKGAMVCAKADAIMQFTGLQDSNGKDIYEGDIIKDFLERKFKVFFCERHHRWELKGNKEDGFNYGVSVIDWFYELSDLPKIIGNIYETPELLN